MATKHVTVCVCLWQISFRAGGILWNFFVMQNYLRGWESNGQSERFLKRHVVGMLCAFPCREDVDKDSITISWIRLEKNVFSKQFEEVQLQWIPHKTNVAISLRRKKKEEQKRRRKQISFPIIAFFITQLP